MNNFIFTFFVTLLAIVLVVALNFVSAAILVFLINTIFSLTIKYDFYTLSSVVLLYLMTFGSLNMSLVTIKNSLKVK